MLKTLLPQFPQLKVLGDAHLGKRFLADVPLHRRGERERMVFAHFWEALTHEVSGLDHVVQTGDIFDSFVVPLEVVMSVIVCLEQAAKLTGANYYIYRGNHDGSRDADKVSSFDILSKFFHGHQQIKIIKDVEAFRFEGLKLCFMPWHPFTPAAELAQQVHHQRLNQEMFDVVFTHCDLDSFGEKDFNVLPYDALAGATHAVINGHIHSPEERQVGLLKVIMPGSMEPYSHAEDPDGDFYTTMTLQEFLKADYTKLVMKNVRILLEENENLPDEIPNCLSFTAKRVKKADEFVDGDDSEQVTMEEFSMANIIGEALQRAVVPARISDKILAKFEESRNVEK